ncbi:MAG: PilW family protein [Rhodanobacteraceae bacterium]
MQARSTPVVPRRASDEAGFTLIELMIAMILGLIVIAGVTSVFLAGQQSFRTNDALAEVQDNTRVAFELMARDIRDAGLTGCSSKGYQVNVLNDQATAWWANWGNAVRGYDAGQTDPAVTVGTGLAQRFAGTSSLQLLGAADQGYTIAAPGETTAYSFTLNETSPNLASGDIVILCDPGQVAFFQIGAYNAGTRTFTYSAAGTPGNDSVILDATIPGAGPPQPFPANSQLSLYTAADWYIGNNDSGGTSLYRLSLQNTGGAVAPAAQEMVRNVSAMTITYLQRGNAGFLTAAAVTDWSQVTAVRVALTMTSTFTRATTGPAPTALSRQYAFTTSLRNR